MSAGAGRGLRDAAMEAAVSAMTAFTDTLTMIRTVQERGPARPV